MNAVLSTRVALPWSKDLAWIKKELTIMSTPTSALGTSAKLEMYEIKDSFIHVPKAWAIENAAKLGITSFEDEQYAGTGLQPVETELTLPLGLRPHQALAVEAIVKAFHDEALGGGALLCLSCGMGKSVTALEVIHRMGLKTLIIVNTAVLASQWRNVIAQYVPGARVGLIQQAKFEVENKTHVVAVAHTVAGGRYDFSEAGFGLCITDECLPYTQRVQTADGPRTIGSLYDQFCKSDPELPMVPSLNEETGEMELKRITHAFKKTNLRVLHIKYSASVLKCTSNHRILTVDGYKTADELNVGDILVSNFDKDNTLEQSAAARMLNGDQYQIVLGSFLGDGHIQKLPSGRYRLKVIHGQKQSDYCAWKAQMFGCDLTYIEKNGYAQTPAVTFATKMFDLHPEKLFPKSKTTCPQWLLEDLDAKGLAIWWMDDGTLARDSVSGALSTCSFDKDSHIRILAKLKVMGVEGQIYESKGYESIRFNEQGIMSLLTIIAPYAHDDIAYKFSNDLLRQRSMEFYSGSASTIYSRLQDIPQSLRTNGTQFQVGTALFTWKYCVTCDKSTFQLQNNGYLRCLHDRKMDTDQIVALTLDSAMYEWDSTMATIGTVRVEKITEKENTRSGGNAVFDLEVEDNHNFVACGQGGIGPIVHNCHRVCCPTLSKCISKAGTRHRLGLTATPTRPDGFNTFLQYAIGDIAFQLQRDNPEDLRVYSIHLDAGPCRMHTIKAKGKQTPCIAKILNDMQGTEPRALERQAVAAKWIRRCADKGRQILVVADRISLLEELAEMVNDDLAVAFLIGKTKAKDRETAKDARVIFASYPIAAEGLDITTLDSLLMLTPRSGSNVIVQSVGRLLRSGGRSPLVIDLVDNLSVYQNMYRKRCKEYREMGATITKWSEHDEKL